MEVRPTESLEYTSISDGRTYEAGIDYAPRTGQAVVRVKGLLGSTLGTPTLINANGDFTSFAQTHLSATDQQRFRSVAERSIIQAYNTNGGNGNGNRLPSWVDPNAGQVERSTNQDGQQSGNNFTGLLGGANNLAGFTVTERTIRAMMPLQYPKDAIYENRTSGYNQDYVRILQYTYKAPKPSLVKGGKGIDIATKGVQRKSPLEKYLGQVKLPMPNDVTDSNNVAWGQDTMSNFSAAITSIVGGNLGATAASTLGGAVLGGVFGNASKGAEAATWASILSNSGISGDALKGNETANAGLRAALQSRLLAQAGVQVSPEAILARGLGVIPNANMELLFQAPALREFQFNWKMTPRDEEEARKIRNIIRFFKQGMAARKVGKIPAAGASSLFLKTPNVFHIQYKTNRGNNSEGLNRIKTCALTGTSVNYTPEGVWASYEEGQPVASIMSLRFQELEPVYDTDYQRTVVHDRIFDETPSGSSNLGDLYAIGQNEVGY